MHSARTLLIAVTALVSIALGPLQAGLTSDANFAVRPTQATTVTDLGQQPSVWLCHWMPRLNWICSQRRR